MVRVLGRCIFTGMHYQYSTCRWDTLETMLYKPVPLKGTYIVQVATFFSVHLHAQKHMNFPLVISLKKQNAKVSQQKYLRSLSSTGGSSNSGTEISENKIKWTIKWKFSVCPQVHLCFKDIMWGRCINNTADSPIKTLILKLDISSYIAHKVLCKWSRENGNHA